MIDLHPYIGLTTMMVLATKDTSGNPYTANVYFKTDEKYNFYYKSKVFREHSKHIDQDKNVAWSILNTEKYEKTAKDKKGLQFQGVAQVLTGKEAEKVSKKIYGTEKTFPEMLQAGHLIYRCTPTRVKIWDETIYGGEGKVIEF